MESLHSSIGSQINEQEMALLRESLAEEIKLIEENEKRIRQEKKGRSQSEQNISNVAKKVMEGQPKVHFSSFSHEERPNLLQRSKSQAHFEKTKENTKKEEAPLLKRKYSEKKISSSKRTKETKKGWGISFSFFKKSNFKNKLVTPILTKQEWEKQAAVQLEGIIEKKFHGIRVPQEIVKHFIKTGVLTTNCKKRLNEANEKEKLSFLTPFIEIDDPKVFLDEATKLSKNKKNYKTFLEVIGGKETLEILNFFLDPYKKHKWANYVEKFLLVDLAQSSCSLKKVGYTYGFDSVHPLSRCNPEDVPTSFRYYALSKNIDRTLPFFVIGKDPVFIPMPRESESDQEKLENFLYWLIVALELQMKIENSFIDAAAQSKYFMTGMEDNLEKKKLIEEMKKVFEKKGMKDLVSILNMMKELNFPKEMNKWAEYNLLSLIGKKTNQSADMLAHTVIKEYFLQKHLKYCKENIPSFRLLQCLTINAFSYAQENLTTLCPDLVKPQLTQHHCLKQKYGPTYFNIQMDPKKKVFVVQHKKEYMIQDPIDSTKKYGTVRIVWSIQGNLETDYFSPTLHMEDLIFSKDLTLNARYEILQKLGLLGTASLS